MSSDPSVATYTTGKLAKMFNVAPGTIKNWTADGTLPNVPKTRGGHRRYTEQHVAILRKMLTSPPATPSNGEVGNGTAS